MCSLSHVSADLGKPVVELGDTGVVPGTSRSPAQVSSSALVPDKPGMAVGSHVLNVPVAVMLLVS